nr:zf-HC2 domain-containing protein [Mycobacterium sp. 852002-30065_SCH5024008]
MMPQRRPGTPADGDSSGHGEYAMWDAAYVLGSLSPVERREFEAHLADCLLCRNAVGELNVIPALWSQLDRDEVARIDETDIRVAEPPKHLLPSLLAQVSWRRRQRRIVSWTAGAVAAAVLAIGVLVGLAGQSSTSAPMPPLASVSAQPMAQVGTDKLASTVSLTSQRWGTSISMNCVCLAPLDAHHDGLAMVVVGRDGSRTRLATWVANPGHTASPAGRTSTRVDQIASVQVVSADDGRVLLERPLGVFAPRVN